MSSIPRMISSHPLWRYRGVVRQLAARDLKVRYKVSVLGFFWSLLRPLLTIAVLAAVFIMLGLKSTRYEVAFPALLLASYMPWFYFSAALLEGVQSLLANAHLVKKVYCPRAVFPGAVVLANLINFALAMAVLIPLLYIAFEARPGWALLQLPLVVAFHTAFLLGLCFMLSALNVVYRDLTQITEFVVFVWFYLSPVLYDSFEAYDRFGARAWLYFLNPMAGILEWYRYSLLASRLQTGGEMAAFNHMTFYFAIPYAAAASIVMLAVGYVFLRRWETRAVDEL